MALTDAQFNSIVRATASLRQKGKTLNFSRRVTELRNQANARKAENSSRPQQAQTNSAPPPKPRTPNATG